MKHTRTEQSGTALAENVESETQGRCEKKLCGHLREESSQAERTQEVQRPWGRSGSGLFKGSKKEAGAYRSRGMEREREAAFRRCDCSTWLPEGRGWGKLYIRPEAQKGIRQTHKDSSVFMDSTTYRCPETQPTSLLPGC